MLFEVDGEMRKNNLSKTEKWKRKISRSIKKWHKHIGHSDRTKKKISKKLKGRFIGEKNWNWKGGKPKCIDCEKQLANIYAKRCVVCSGVNRSKDKLLPKLYFCINCGEKIRKGMIRCQSCYLKTWRNKKNHPNWKGGRPKCIDCGKEISRKGGRCRVCYSIFARGKNHPLYKEKDSCVDCGKEMKYSGKRCRFCYFKTWENKENLPAWQGGKSFEPYSKEFDNKLKEFIRRRDNYRCQNKDCKIPEKECFTKLYIHHIDYNKTNNDPVNLIALCHQCHRRSNVNRDYWKECYQKIQINRKVHELENNTASTIKKCWG